MKKIRLFVLMLISICNVVFAQPLQNESLQFIQNKGQWENQILYKLDVPNGAVFFEKNCFTWSFSNIAEITDHTSLHSNHPEKKTFKQHAFKSIFVGANLEAQLHGEFIQKNYYNYFIGDDQSKWKGRVPAFASIIYKNIYENIDLVVKSEEGNMKYDFIVKPHASVQNIQIKYEGIFKSEIINGNLHLLTSLNKIIELKPVAYQLVEGVLHEIACNFNLEENLLTFYFPNGYDQTKELIIDPATLIFASYTGSTSDNWGYTATYDSDGNLYGGGIVFGDGYPTTLGAFETEFQGGFSSFPCDVGISKFNSTGSDLIYSTYLGGGGNEIPHSLVVDSSDQLIVFGTTGSDEFPTSAGAFDESFNGGSSITVTYVVQYPNGSDIFLSKFSEDGASLIGSTFIGGNGNDGLNQGVTAFNYGDHARGEVVVDELGNTFLASSTNSTNFPTTSGVIQENIAGEQDGIIAKFNDDFSDLFWSTYIGGDSFDGAFSLKKSADENIVVCGGTASTDFPVIAGAYDESFNGGTTDGFLIKMNSDATSLIGSTFLGTTSYDQAFLIETDIENNIYTTGQTTGNFAVIGDVYSNDESSQFLTKLTPDLTEIIFSTVFGSGSATVNMSPSALLVDNCENIYVSGWGGSVNASFNPSTGYVTGMPITGDAFQSTTDGSDFYFILFEKNAGALIYATYFGGATSSEHVDGGTSRFDKKGRIYQAVCAGCGGSDAFPTTDGSYSENNGSGNCNLGVIKFEFNFIGPDANVSASPLNGCLPVEVFFLNSSTSAENYFWDFGDGNTSIEAEPTYVFDQPGVYQVLFVAIDEDACIPYDSSFITIEVYGFPEANFTFSPDPANLYQVVSFVDASTDAVSWIWSFGDGSGSTLQNPTHQYINSGKFEICLYIENEFGCTDEICDSIEILEVSLLETPNAFTPNGDGINDFFSPIIYGLDYFEIFIYNRWGQLIFYSNDPNYQWDGTYQGEELDMETFVYYLNGTGTDEIQYSRKGNITLVR